jgi:hypothetical protein
MGYSITIGNAKPEFNKDDGELWARWTVDGLTLPDAPTFPHDEVTGNSNGRSPSYSGWADFCRECDEFANGGRLCPTGHVLLPQSKAEAEIMNIISERYLWPERFATASRSPQDTK